MQHLNFQFAAVFFALAIFAGMLIFLEVGRRIGIRQLERHGEEARTGIGVVDGAVYAVFSLLIGFTFSGAASRFDARREIVGHATRAIGIAWSTVDLLPSEGQPAIRDGLRRYVDALVSSYGDTEASASAFREPPAMARARTDVWSQSVAAVVQPNGERARMLLLPALYNMFDVVEQERLARRIHAPLVIYAMLGVAALATALFAGLGVAHKTVHNRTLTLGVAATIAMAVYVIIELEFPRLGAIRVSSMDAALVELRETMK